VAGAWDELLDRYSELGYAVPLKTTRIHVAGTLQQQLPADAPQSLRGIATSTDEAVFSGLDIDGDHSERVWTEALAAIEVATGAVTGARRLLSRFRIRSAREWVGRLAGANAQSGDAAAAPRRRPIGRRSAAKRVG
jgi:hypothetical protein